MSLSNGVTKSNEVSLNYFTCTLGQAAAVNAKVQRQFQTINEFIELQASQCPSRPAVAFPIPNHQNEHWNSAIFTFEDLLNGSIATANALASVIHSLPEAEEPFCVALLCPSSIDFIFTWLALMRIGLSVLLIAPQCQPEAIAHLCNACNVTLLLHDQAYAKLAKEAVSISFSGLFTELLPWQACHQDIASLVRLVPSSSEKLSSQHFNPNALTVAYIHHTSGTSSGLPKPIPQTHHAGIGVLPCLDGASHATFTTTPLYHGGIADCFRAWTSGALIWLFPGADVPITTRNILNSLSVARSVANPCDTPQVKYFSSVPYILQMLAEDETALKLLRDMEIVGVGGAALPSNIGDALVADGIHLVSRFGSAECGFLLSSHRNYSHDFNWQHLRAQSSLLQFEPQDDESGLFELVILKGWPHIAKTNREDGSLATSDLFEPHENIEGAWRYHSRNDSQITLVTGKKFDPAPVEDELRASSPHISDVLIFGNGRQMPGALVFAHEAEDKLVDNLLKEKIWCAVEEINQKGQAHTRISRDMLVIKPKHTLEKSSKGTILRSASEQAFAEDIERLYTPHTIDTRHRHIKDTDVKGVLRDIVHTVAEGRRVDDGEDFYHHGIDSAKCTTIRGLLLKSFSIEGHVLPWNVVYDCGNIDKLSQYILSIQSGINSECDGGTNEMQDLVEQYSVQSSITDISTPQNQPSPTRAPSKTVLLTGATGALGAHILDVLCCDTSIAQIVCLVRASSNEVANDRVDVSLKQRKRPRLENRQKVLCLSSQLGEKDLGLAKEDFDYLRQNVTAIIHAAWAVNFSLPLRTFVKDHIAGLQNLLNLTLSTFHNASFVFCSSTASVLGPSRSSQIQEEISTAPSDADKLGYSRSKWVAEAVCSRASNAVSASGDVMRGRIKILRIGQLTGDTENGIWNMSEAYPLMLSTVNQLGCLPGIDECLNWLPLNVAARSVVEIALSGSYEPENTTIPVYHIVNNRTSSTWSDLLKWLQNFRPEPFEVVEPQVWLQRLESLERHPAKGLLGLWKAAYGGTTVKGKMERQERVLFATGRAYRTAPSMRNIQPVDPVLFHKIWNWIEEEGGIN